MSNTTFLHLSYLQQVSDLLRDKHIPQAARLGHIAKKIQLKYLVHIKGSDPPKLTRCKACQAPLCCGDMRAEKDLIILTCPLCYLKTKYSSSIVRKKSGRKRRRRKRTKKIKYKDVEQNNVKN